MYEISRIIPYSKRLPNQIGYQKRPIVDAVLDVIETISKVLSVEDDVQCTSVDFSETFDTVDHNIFLKIVIYMALDTQFELPNT